jgi:hypothetical protein
MNRAMLFAAGATLIGGATCETTSAVPLYGVPPIVTSSDGGGGAGVGAAGSGGAGGVDAGQDAIGDTAVGDIDAGQDATGDAPMNVSIDAAYGAPAIPINSDATIDTSDAAGDPVHGGNE